MFNKSHQKGSITLYTGPMFSGKSSALRATMLRYYKTSVPRKCIVVRPSIDIRNDGCVKTHSGDELHMETVCVDNIMDCVDKLGEYDVIGFDEIQFFDDAVEACLKLRNQGKHVYASGLIATSDNKMWKTIINLMPHCDVIKKFKSICAVCGCDEGIYSRRKIVNNDEVCIGGSDVYVSVCYECDFI